jgi:hypothetical protein
MGVPGWDPNAKSLCINMLALHIVQWKPHTRYYRGNQGAPNPTRSPKWGPKHYGSLRRTVAHPAVRPTQLSPGRITAGSGLIGKESAHSRRLLPFSLPLGTDISRFVPSRYPTLRPAGCHGPCVGLVITHPPRESVDLAQYQSA